MIIQNGVGITSLLNGNTVKEALNAANELVNRGIYNPTTLSAVDADLVVGNIKKDVNIFGKVGTLEPLLTAEAQSGTGPTISYDHDGSTGAYLLKAIAGGGDLDPFITKTDTFSVGSMAVAGIEAMLRSLNTSMKLRLFMGGVQVAETAFLPGASAPTELLGSRALSGSQIIKLTVHNYGGSDDFWWHIADRYGATSLYHPRLIVGCVKVA